MAGLVKKLWSLVRTKELVGKDKAGNCFYRKVDGKETRWVVYKGDPDPNILPAEWYSWLIGRRKEAPTPEEMAALEAHRKLVKMKAAIYEKEEEKRRFKSKTLQQQESKDEMKHPEMNKFVEQVAELEGIKIDGGEGTFIDGVTQKKPDLIESNDPAKKCDASADVGVNKPEIKISRQRGKTDVYEKWVP